MKDDLGDTHGEIDLTNSELKVLIDAADFKFVSDYNWYLSTRGYACTTINGKKKRMHRVIMSPPDHLQIDHINRNKLDNTRKNLRVCTQKENARNRPISKSNTSGFKGVHLEPRNKYSKWRAGIYLNGIHVHIGSFRTKEEAAKAYNDTAIRHFGDFAVLNTL